MMIRAMNPAKVASVRPQWRASMNTPDTTPIICSSPTARSVASASPKTLKKPASTQTLPGP